MFITLNMCVACVLSAFYFIRVNGNECELYAVHLDL